MSFITKRERVFNEYDAYDLPSRNEGKLKAYSSCTDARAWSHFCSDKSEHLVEIIRRNNEKCKTKYVPTEAIVNTLLASKLAEIARLKRKIGEFEQMLAVYEELDLTCAQKCEISKAHKAIKDANRGLNELCLDLDLSNFTGTDSEDFETGKSRGDEPTKYRDDYGDEPWFVREPVQKESKGIQAGATGDGEECDCKSFAISELRRKDAKDIQAGAADISETCIREDRRPSQRDSKSKGSKPGAADGSEASVCYESTKSSEKSKSRRPSSAGGSLDYVRNPSTKPSQKELKAKGKKPGGADGSDSCNCQEALDLLHKDPKSKGSKPGAAGGTETGACDERTKPLQMDSKNIKPSTGGREENVCNASTNVVDPRIEQMQGVIIGKDAKLNAMKNTMAVMENDVCEPYCIYAHIYTALEKIFGILCQNDKYKVYLDLMTAGKDTRGIDIKGKILLKLKVFEKFSLALIAPCSQDFSPQHGCSCYRAEIASHMDTEVALKAAETHDTCLDSKRAHLVADIMENDEMKEILSKESASLKSDLDMVENIVIESYSIDKENINRLKNLQGNYNDLMTCYEALKHEKDCLLIRCQKNDELEKELQMVQTQLREYNALWNEKEHYRKRSADLDSLKEKYMVLYDETANLETELKAESEINNVKTKTIDELRDDNIALEKRLNETSIAFEKEKNYIQCKLKESECTIMCQGQQIRSLSLQIDRLLEQEPDKIQSKQYDTPTIELIDEINSLKEQIKNLQDALYCSEEEKQQIQEEYQNMLNTINNLKIEVEDWKSNYEKTLQRNDYLEKYTDSFRDEVRKLLEENRTLSQNVEEKSIAIDNLMDVIKNKSEQVNNLMNDVEYKTKENTNLCDEIHSLKDAYNRSITSLNTEKSQTMQSLHIAKQESRELLQKVKDYDDIVLKKEDLSHLYQKQTEEFNQLKSLIMSTQKEKKNLLMDLTNRENNNSILLKEIQRLQEVNNFAVNDISSLKDETEQYKVSLELTRKDSKILQDKLHCYEELANEMQQLKESHEKLITEKCRLENELADKTFELDSAIREAQLTKKQIQELEYKLENNEHFKNDFKNVDDAYKKLILEQQLLQLELNEKKRGFDNLLESFNNLKNSLERINDKRSEEVAALCKELDYLKKAHNELLAEKSVLQNDYDNKIEEINNLYNTLESKIEENRELSQKLQLLEVNQKTVQNKMDTLQEENFATKNTLNTLKKESDELIGKVKYYKILESEYDQLKKELDRVKGDQNRLQVELDVQIMEKKRIEKDNQVLNKESESLFSHSEVLEKALINARNELMVSTSSPKISQTEIMREIEEMKREKILNHQKIKDLLDKLDESENNISILSEDILARDDKIAMLENHINELQDEVRKLHSSLAEIVNTGEEIKDNSYQRIRNSMNLVEAHHSKATHNMKMELAKLQNDNMKLEERLSISKMKSEDSARDKHKYVSQITDLQNEREIIVTDIKQLEMKSVGDSALSPENCDVEHILSSLDRIRRYIDARCSKSTSLEKTLLKVQNSYQVVQSKADEAKKIVEKEKQKILNEKEEAIRDKLGMEKEFADLKYQLKMQVSQDKKIIKDLEAEILNQKLIFDKLNKSTQSYITKLQEELQSLKDFYQKSIEDVSELEKRLQLMSEEKKIHLNTIETVNIKLEEKCNEINTLKIDLEKLKNKSSHSLGTQALVLERRDEETQTNNRFNYEDFDQYHVIDTTKKMDDTCDFIPIHTKKPVHERKILEKDNLKHVNEVQILTANVDPTFECIENRYLSNKLQNLSLGRLEQYSISSKSEDNMELDNKDINKSKIKESNKVSISEQGAGNINVIDIYNKQSMRTNSSKIISSNYPENERDLKSHGKASGITDFSLTNDSFEAKSSLHKASNLFGSVSGVSTDKDLFVIYQDSETNYADKSNDKKSWPANGRSDLLVEAITIHSDRNNQNQFHNKLARHKQEQYDTELDPFFYLEDEELNEDDSVKHKLKISLPRVGNDSTMMDTASDSNKKSQDSYIIYSAPKSTHSLSDHETVKSLKIKTNNLKAPSAHSLSNDGTLYLDTYISTEDENIIHTSKKKMKSDKGDKSTYAIPLGSTHNKTRTGSSFVKTLFINGSHHNLSRIDADIRLIQTKTDTMTDNNMLKSEAEGLRLDFILAAAHMDPEKIKIYNATKSIRKARSNELLFNSIKLRGKSDSSPSRICDEKKSSTDYKTISSHNNNQYSLMSPSKTYTERSIMVNLYPEEYEMKIKLLTNNLENIEKDYKKKIEAIKLQYDSNIKSILNEHNEGVKNIQGLHEVTLQDIIKHHENEVENLRSMSIEAMRKANKLEKEVRSLKCKIPICSSTCLEEEPIKFSSPESRKRKSRINTKTLTKTNVEAFNVRPKSRSKGPCTCSLDINISDTIRNIFEQVDGEQKKIAEQKYLKHIANKILRNNVEALDCQELSFLHLKVCRTWKVKLTKEELLQKRIDTLEAELMTKQRHTHNDMAEIDRKLAEERRRLQEVREAVCRSGQSGSRYENTEASYVRSESAATAEMDFLCNCDTGPASNVDERRSGGDLTAALGASSRPKRVRPDSHRAVLAKLDAEGRREKKLRNDEPPTRLRRSHDRPVRSNKKY